MKKYIIVSLLAISFILSPVFVSAQTSQPDQIATLIRLLQSLIQLLQQQLSMLQGQNPLSSQQRADILQNLNNSTNDEIPNIIKNITTDAETGGQKPEISFQIVGQVRKDVQNGKLLWFKDPVEVSKKYGNRFGIGLGAQYVLEQGAAMGGESGLWHSSVLATYNSKSYRITLIAEPVQPLIWVFNAVTDIQRENKLRVNFFGSESTYDIDGISHNEIVSRFGDGTTLFYLNVQSPTVTFYLNQPADPTTVNSGSIIVKVNNTVLNGATAKYVVKQESTHGATFPSYSIQVNLSNVPNLRNYAGQNIQIILTDKIKDNSGSPLQQCDRLYNKGECVADSSGQKLKVFGAELKLYSLN